MRPELTNVLGLRLSVRRSRLLLALIILCFLVLVARALYLQCFENPYKTAEQPWLAYTEMLRANRGKITDRRGVPLAISTSVKTVCASPRDVVLSVSDHKKLSHLLQIQPVLLTKRLSQKNKGCVYLKRQISPDKGISA